jgi:predicted ATPase
LAQGTRVRDVALVTLRPGEVDLPQLHQSLGVASHARTYWFALLAEAYGKAGQVEAGLRVLAEGQAVVGATEEHYWEAELYRLRGELLQHASRGAQDTEWTPEGCFRHALDVARRQQAKSLELRAALSLARLWQSQGKRDEARELLEPVYSWFTEGFDTADLQEAKQLLDELAA